MKAANCIAGPYDDLLLPPGSTKTDWEAEVGVLIGRQARYLRDESDADACIGGYVISHDVSEREWQMERGGQWVKGKSFEGFNPLGPALVTADEVADPSALHIRTYVNDALRQDGTCSDMIFSARHIVWYLSQFMVLEPGDLVNTGTPSGVGHRMSPPRYLGAGDIVRIEIAGLGSQRTVVAAAQPVD
jgi:2-keto-4-pentenoate hydratase/2-oxohepta-3-ene-1,7-dioic acid hydratase in catechol pathway